MLLYLLLLVPILGTSSTSSYNQFATYKVHATTHNENKVLQSLENQPGFDFWSKINKLGQPITIMVAPQEQSNFLRLLKMQKISYEIEIENLETVLLAERLALKYRPLHKDISFANYLTHNEINAYLQQLVADNPTKVSLVPLGKSLEERDILAVRISNSELNETKPVIFIEAGMHAREWIAPALALYLINQLVEESANANLYEKIDWIILPTINPDGYVYTWTTDRLWRKTRSKGNLCNGVDGNRNFGFHWMENGASANECSETFAGRKEFSEIEAQHLRNALASTENIAAFVSLHSYGQLLFYPYSYENNAMPDNWQELQTLAEEVGRVIAAINGTEYTVGSSTGILYPAAGCSDDWAMGGAGIKLVLTFELPGGGPNGFDLPPERILPVVRETFEGIKVIADYITPK